MEVKESWAFFLFAPLSLMIFTRPAYTSQQYDYTDMIDPEQRMYERLYEQEKNLMHALLGSTSYHNTDFHKGTSYSSMSHTPNSHHATYDDYGDRAHQLDNMYSDDYGYGGRYNIPPQTRNYEPKEMDGYRQQQDYDDHQSMGYGYKPRRPKKKKSVFKFPQKKEKKMKIISLDRGFYIPGGTQMFGKFKTLKGCMKACAATPNCFAGDYNPWFGRCYVHSNLTACNTLRAHKKLTHFKKVPCTVPEAPLGLLILGAQLFKGLEQKGIKSLTDCLKKCAAAGGGIPATVADILDQVCFGIDYDFSSHKCYFHVENQNPDDRICSATVAPVTPRDLVANPSTIFIALCPALA